MRRSPGSYVRIGRVNEVYLFDASSIVNLVRKGIVKPLADGVTLDLALYESLSAVWKEFKLLKRFDEAIALELLDIICDVFNAMKIISAKGLEKEVFDLASKEELTIYDAAYVCAAMRNELTLVTDDQELRRTASKLLKVTSSSELASKYRD